MKNLKHTFTLLVTTLLLITSCSKDDDGNDQNQFTPPTAAAFKALQEQAFNNLKQFATFNAEDGITFESAAGVTLTILGNCLSLNGNTVTGAVELEFVEIFDRSDMLFTNKTTTGKKPDNTFQPLISGGQFFVKAYQNNEELTTNCGFFISVPVDITGGVQNEMSSFTGIFDENDNLIWLPQVTDFWIGQNQVGTMSYNAIVQDFTPFNCDYFASFPDPKTEIQISLPTGFNYTNSQIYVATPSRPNSLALLFGEFPIGMDIHVIFVSLEGDNYRYAIKSITVENNQQLIYTIEETNVVPYQELADVINSLP